MRTAQQRGATLLEAILVISLLLVLWLGLVELGNSERDRLDAEARARSCAWRIAMKGCDQVVPGCGGATTSRGKPPTAKTSALATHGRHSPTKQKVDRDLETSIEGVLFQRVTARGSSKSSGRDSRSLLTPSGNVEQNDEQGVVAEHSLPCNTKPGGVDDLVADLAGDFF